MNLNHRSAKHKKTLIEIRKAIRLKSIQEKIIDEVESD